MTRENKKIFLIFYYDIFDIDYFVEWNLRILNNGLFNENCFNYSNSNCCII